MVTSHRDENAVYFVYNLLKMHFFGWNIAIIRPPISGARGLYDISLYNPYFSLDPVFVRVEKKSIVIRKKFDLRYNFSSEIFFATTTENLILFIIVNNGFFIFNPKRGWFPLKRNDRITSNMLL
jgi:hypothetical protein